MVFGNDMIINAPLIADWGAIRLHKQKHNGQNNQIEKINYKPHIYIIQDKVLVRNKNQISMRSCT